MLQCNHKMRLPRFARNDNIEYRTIALSFRERARYHKTPRCHSENGRATTKPRAVIPRRGDSLDVGISLTLLKRDCRASNAKTRIKKLKFQRENYETQRTTRTNIRAFKKQKKSFRKGAFFPTVRLRNDDKKRPFRNGKVRILKPL